MMRGRGLLLLLVTACSSRALDAGLSIALSEPVPTVVIASWSDRSDATQAWVDFGPTEDLGWTAPAVLSDGTWRATLVGLKPESTGWLQPGEQVDGQLRSGSLHQVQTGALSSGLPSLVIQERADPATASTQDMPWSDGFLLASTATNPAAAIIVDPDGDMVWGLRAEGVGEIARVRLGVDGQSIWIMGINAHNEGHNLLVNVGLDGSLIQEIDVGDAHHDFFVHDDGTIAWLTHTLGPVDGGLALGDSLTVRQVSGSTDTLWSIWDWRDYDPTEGLGTSTGAVDGDAVLNDWTHCNALNYQDGVYLVGSLGLGAIMEIDASTGQLEWTFGSSTSDVVDPSGSTTLLTVQHQFQLLDDSLLVFENGSSEQRDSRIVEFSFDPKQPIVSEIWSYHPDPAVYSMILGNPIRLDNGHTIANFAVAGQIDEITPAGDLVWRLSSPLGTAFGYVQMIASPYEP